MKFVFRKEFMDGWEYLKKSKNYIYSIILIFFFFTLVGFFVSPPEEVSKQIFEYIQTLLEKTAGFGLFEMIQFIFFNNLKSSFIGLFSGIFVGLFSLINGILNGYLLGFVSSLSVQEAGIFSLWRIFPHGIFELPAIFISLGLGLKMGSFVFRKKKIPFLRTSILNSVKVFFLIVLPLLLIGSIIEGILIVFSR